VHYNNSFRALPDYALNGGFLVNRDTSTNWWLRSPGYSFYAALVNGDGSVNGFGNYVNLNIGVRPAFKLNPSSVIFASEIKSGADVTKGETEADANYSAAAAADAKNYKLTIVDSTLSAGSLTAGGETASSTLTKTVAPGDTLSVAAASATAGTNLTYKIVNSSGTLVGYGQGADNTGVDVTATDLSGTNLADDSYTVYVWAQQNNTFTSHTGSAPEYFTMTVSAASVNTAPTINGQTGNSTDTITLTEGYAQYPESYTITGNPTPSVTIADTDGTGAWFDDTTGELIIPAGLNAESYTIRLTAANSEPPDAVLTVTVHVNPAAPAATLTVDPMSDDIVNEGEPYTKTIPVTYLNGTGTLGYSSTSTLPLGLSLNTNTGKISGTPEAGTAGSYPITVRVTDGTLADSGDFTLTVEANTPPATLTLATPTDITVTEGEPFTKTLSVTYTGNDPLEYSATGLPSGVSINQATGVFGGAAAAGTAGSYPVDVYVTDNNGLDDDGNFTLTVYPAYTPPTTTHTIAASAGTGGSISPSGNVTVNDGGSQTFAIAADSGYSISDVTVDGSGVGAVNSYTFSNVTADHIIRAEFSQTATPTPSRDSDSGSGGSGTQDTVRTVTAPQPVTLAQAKAAYEAALQATKESGGDTVKPKLSGYYSEIPLDILQALAGWAKRDGMAVRLTVDVRKDFAVTARYVFDPSTAGRTISLLASADNPSAINTAARFRRWFTNKLAIVSTGQSDGYGIPVDIAVKVDLAGLDTENLYFYSYDSKTNTYRRVEKPAYWIDKNGYLHFTTELAGDIIISEGVLERK